MATREELLQALRNADAAGDTVAATRIAEMVRKAATAPLAPAAAAGAAPEPQAGGQAPLSPEARAFRTLPNGQQMSTEGEGTGLESVLGGLKHSWDRGALGLKQMFPKSIQEATDKYDKFFDPNGASLEDTVRRGAAYVKEAGPGANVGQTTGDVALGTGAGAASKAGVIADVAGNALLNNVLTPGDARDKAMGSGIGAGSALGGRILTRALSGPLKPAISPEASILIDQDILPTPGQMISGEGSGGIARSVRAMEDRATSLPIIGDIIQSARNRAAKEYNKREINDALEPVGVKLNLTGRDALDRAHARVDDIYNAVQKDVSIDPVVGRPTIAKALRDIDNNGQLDADHMQVINKIIGVKIDPLVSGKVAISGAKAKNIDDYLTEQIKLAKRTPSKEPLVGALESIQDAWQSSMQGTTPEAVQSLKGVMQSKRNLRVLEKATEGSDVTMASPRTMQNAAKSLGEEPTALSGVARPVLGNTIGDTGTAGRQMLGNAINWGKKAALGGGAAVLFPNSTAAAAATTLGVYSKPGLNYLAKGFQPATSAVFKLLPGPVQQQLLKMAPEDAEQAIRQLSTQMMRSQATQGQE
jgi:hypothetical protein